MKDGTMAPGEWLRKLRIRKDELLALGEPGTIRNLEELNRELAELAIDNPRYVNVVSVMQKEIADKIADLSTNGQREGAA